MKGEVIDSKKLKKKNKGIDLNDLNILDSADLVSKIIDSKLEYEKVKEEEKTKRFAIQKSAEMQIKKIEATKELVSEISKSVFDERAKVIDKNFEILERALDEDKNDVAIQALSGITDIVKESPLKDFESISNALKSDDVDLIL